MNTLYNFIKVDFFWDNIDIFLSKLNERLSNGNNILNFGEENIGDIEYYHKINTLYHQLEKNKNIHFIFNQTANTSILNSFMSNDEYTIINIDLFNSFLPTHLNLQRHKSSFSYKKNKPLLQIGNFNQDNRLLLLTILKKFLGDDLTYGFYPSKFWEDSCHEQYYNSIKEFTNIKYDDIKKYVFNLENHLDLDVNTDNTGFPYKTWPYEDSSISIISETNSPFEIDTIELSYLNVTEKTYRTIINHQPFLFFGGANQLEKLNMMGLYTFNDVLPEKDYNLYEYIICYVENPANYYIDVINKNLIYYLEKIDTDNSFYEKIKTMCDSNFMCVKNEFNKIIQSNKFFRNKHNLQNYFRSAYNFEEAYYTEQELI